MHCLLLECTCNTSFDWSSFVTIFVSVLTLIATIYVPEKIKWEQTYSSLVSLYLSYDFARALQGIVEFFNVECKQDVELIKEKYEEHFIKEVNAPERSADRVLHFQRRLLAQFYTQLDLCARTPFFFIGKRRVQKDFTKREANLIRVLYFMGKAIEESSILYKDISCDERVSPRVRGQNKYLSHIYEVLKTSKRFME